MNANLRNFVRASLCQLTILLARVRCQNSREVLDRRLTDRRCIGMNICKISAIIYVSHLSVSLVTRIELYQICTCFCLAKKSYCSYAEFRNVTLPYSDVVLPGLDIKQVFHVFPLSVRAWMNVWLDYDPFSARRNVIAARMVSYAEPTPSTIRKRNHSAYCILTIQSVLESVR